MSQIQGRTRKKWSRSDRRAECNITGPGVWVTCVKGKEKQAIGETYDLFETLASDLWPPDENEKTEDDPKEDEEDLEKAISREIEKIKRPRKETHFASCQTNTPCLIFISCKPPVDPVHLVSLHMKRVEDTGITHTRSTHRFTPVTNSCDANVPEISSLCKRTIIPIFEKDETVAYSYKVELRMRNHNTLSRDDIIRSIAQCIPQRHKVDLRDPELFILVEVFKAICGMSVVRDYYRYKKLNVIELSNARLAAGSDCNK